MNKKPQWGLYRSSARQFSVRVPLNWSIRELKDRVEILSDAEDVAVIISSYSKATLGPVNAIAQLKRFLDTVKAAGKPEIRAISSRRATVEYNDRDGAKWYAVVQTRSQRFLLATCNTGAISNRQSVRTGRDIVETLRFEAKT